MIAGIGTDIVAVARLEQLFKRHGQRAASRLLSLDECSEFSRSNEQGRFLAKRFAAKEAFGKALGTGLTAPATLTNIAVGHDTRGRPLFEYAEELSTLLVRQGLIAHLSISDERDYAIAFVIMERI